jgi:N-acetylglucosaminyl-diphospho-decaprenol L-rhamnosyltransferase
VSPSAAIVVASRNRREELRKTLPRHLALPERPLVVLVDDASTDGTPEMVRREFPEVRLVTLTRSAGGAARNAGMRAVDVPYVAFCDDDSWFEPGSIARAVELLERHPRLAVVNGHVLVGEDERDDPLCHEMAQSPIPPAGGQPGHPLLSFIACAVVVRREAVLGVGGFSERFGVGGEEELLSWDLVTAGWELSYVPEIVAHHCPPPNAGRPERREVGIRNMLWTQWLRRPAGAAAARSLREMRRFPRDRTTLRGLARAAAGAPWVLRERRVSPPHVEAKRRLLERQQLASEVRRYDGGHRRRGAARAAGASAAD